MYKSFNNRQLSNEESYYQNVSILTEIRHYFKVIILGNVSVGKTSIMSQFVEEKFQENYKCTISADRQVKSVLVDDNTWVEMNIWDTCGQEKYKTITRQYYKDAKGCILVCDVTNRKSFNDIAQWIEDLREYGDKDTTIIIAGNKSDLEDKKIISFEEASELAKKFKVDYVEVSAKTGLNVKILFELLCNYMIKKYEEPNISRIKKKNDKSRIQFDKYNKFKNNASYDEKKKSGGCCG